LTLSGPDFVLDDAVAKDPGYDDTRPSVAIDQNGNFVVTWTQQSASGTDVEARRFTEGGAPLGAAVAVGQSPQKEHEWHVTMSPSGAFVIAYTRDDGQGGTAIRADLYDNNSKLKKDMDVNVANANLGKDSNSAVAMDPLGRFDIVYEFDYLDPTRGSTL